ncbi:MAG: ACP S-malonyltransferase [Sinobacteraceae bacterium]|nr:ACP S-malonyltransferase [Nevskiaceae bacterium]
MSVAFVFPGQGSQSVGMLAALAELHPVVRETFEAASGALGFDLWALVQNGPAEALALTENTQPVMLVAGVATWRVWCLAEGPRPEWVAGHSLGEFTALVAAGVLSFEDAVRLVRFRGEVMRDAVPDGQGGMAAVLGLSDADVEAACAEAAAGEVVEAVNFNAPQQVVIAGHAAALKRAIEAAKARGAKRALPLPISVPCHSSLMQGAARQLRDRLQAVTLSAPTLRFMSSVDAEEYREPASIADLLYRQLASPVRWVRTVEALRERGVRQFVECGPGKVLAGLVKRIDRSGEISCYALEDQQSIESARTTLQGGADASGSEPSGSKP